MRTDEEIFSDSRAWNHSKFMGLESCMVHLQGCGGCTCVYGRNEYGFEHVSVTPVHQFRIPSWDDMAELKNIFWDDEEEVYQIMPKKSEYVNVVKNCLHLWRPCNGKTLNDLAREVN